MKMKILSLSLIILISCSEDPESKILRNNKTHDFFLYEEVIHDSANFFLFPEDTFANIKFIKSTSKKWDPARFYLSSEIKIREYLNGSQNELSVEKTTYLFSKQADLISDKEKKLLADYSQTIPIQQIKLPLKNYKYISVDDQFKGMCLEFSKPIYSADKQKVFLELYVHLNRTKRKIDLSTYYEKIGFILCKKNEKWKIAYKKIWIML